MENWFDGFSKHDNGGGQSLCGLFAWCHTNLRVCGAGSDTSDIVASKSQDFENSSYIPGLYN
jgi:hypothetical protein